MSPRKASLSKRLAKTNQAPKYEETIEALRRAEQKYRFENATEGIFQTTPDGHYLSANPALARMYGYDSPKELLAALTDISRQLYVQLDRRAEFTLAMRQSGKVLEFESQIYRRDGSIIWISENARAVYDELSGELLYYEGMVQDITRRKCAEEAREKAEYHLSRYAEELHAKNSQFEADLELARDIQQVFLTQKYPSFPRSSTLQESWLRFCHWYQPAEQVGGDFFCVLPLSDTEAGVFICDVLGHGQRGRELFWQLPLFETHHSDLVANFDIGVAGAIYAERRRSRLGFNKIGCMCRPAEFLQR